MKTFLLAASLAAMLAPNAPAQTSGLDLPQVFAGCVGRLSAEMERAWLMAQDEAEAIENQRDAFIALLDAVAPAGSNRALLSYRIETKFAHASLLTTADFSFDNKRAVHAKRIANRHMASCRRLLLGT